MKLVARAWLPARCPWPLLTVLWVRAERKRTPVARCQVVVFGCLLYQLVLQHEGVLGAVANGGAASTNQATQLPRR